MNAVVAKLLGEASDYGSANGLGSPSEMQPEEAVEALIDWAEGMRSAFSIHQMYDAANAIGPLVQKAGQNIEYELDETLRLLFHVPDALDDLLDNLHRLKNVPKEETPPETPPLPGL